MQNIPDVFINKYQTIWYPLGIKYLENMFF